VIKFENKKHYLPFGAVVSCGNEETKMPIPRISTAPWATRACEFRLLDISVQIATAAVSVMWNWKLYRSIAAVSDSFHFAVKL
jgi:hypothetical protein